VFFYTFSDLFRNIPDLFSNIPECSENIYICFETFQSVSKLSVGFEIFRFVSFESISKNFKVVPKHLVLFKNITECSENIYICSYCSVFRVFRNIQI